MNIVDFIAVVSFGLTCFGIRYSFGKDNHSISQFAVYSFLAYSSP